MLQVNNVTKRYGNFTVLQDISLELTNGVWGLLAPNGAGKTTLIKMLTTLVFPTHGQILYNGDEIVRLGAAYRQLLGYLPQDFGYYKNHTPHSFLLYLAALKGLDHQRASKQADNLLQQVGLADVRNQKMRKFSGGMIQRVGIAQALLGNPRILILDEPTAGLDPKERVRTRNLIASLATERIVLLSTHIVADIETIANHVIMLKDHKLFCMDTVPNICNALAGKVFETDNPAAIPAQHLTLTEHYDAGRSITRFASVTAPGPEARPVSPTLEDVFLYVYRDEAA